MSTVRVFFMADVSEDQAERIRAAGPMALVSEDSVPLALPVTAAPDFAVLTEAERLIPRHLSSFDGQESTYRSHLIYWLRVAADVAHRAGS
jgi:hypothetical protein